MPTVEQFQIILNSGNRAVEAPTPITGVLQLKLSKDLEVKCIKIKFKVGTFSSAIQIYRYPVIQI